MRALSPASHNGARHSASCVKVLSLPRLHDASKRHQPLSFLRCRQRVRQSHRCLLFQLRNSPSRPRTISHGNIPVFCCSNIYRRRRAHPTPSLNKSAPPPTNSESVLRTYQPPSSIYRNPSPSHSKNIVCISVCNCTIYLPTAIYSFLLFYPLSMWLVEIMFFSGGESALEDTRAESRGLLV